MHANEVNTERLIVQGLLKQQFPKWAQLPLKRVQSTGTDNAIYRLGSNRAIRLPRIDWAIAQVEKEHTWLPKLAPQLPLSIPTPLEIGMPNEHYPYKWSIYEWLEGENLNFQDLKSANQAAEELAAFLLALQAINTINAPLAAQHNQRGLPLRHRDEATRKAIAELKTILDADLALSIWEEALKAENWQAPELWFHGDLLKGNLLFKQGQLTAVIDFGGLAVGDPACDLMIVWSLLEGESRKLFRKSLNLDAATWLRGQGHALSQAVLFIPYYLNTNPIGVSYARTMLNNLFQDFCKQS